MASLRHFSIASDTGEPAPRGSISRPPSPRRASQSGSSRSLPPWRRSTSADSLLSDTSDDDDEDESGRSSDGGSSALDSPDSVLSDTIDDYSFIKEIPECDMWEPIGEGPAKSFDFGSAGWTASMNVGHEFLQITAPDSACGLVYVRGSFANDPDAILARAQRRVGGKSTFGLKVVSATETPGYELGRRGEEGLLNFRWPYIDFPLTIPGCDAGTCAKFTFIRKGILYQVLRFLPGQVTTPKKHASNERNTKSTADADTSTQKRHATDRTKQAVSLSRPAPWTNRSIKVRIGGKIRFGCPCQRKISQQEGKHFVDTKSSALTITNNTYKQRLEMCLFVDGEQIDPAVAKFQTFGEEVDAAFERSIMLTPGKARVVVATFKFSPKSKDRTNHPLPTSRQLRRELGLSVKSKYAHDRVWLRQIENMGGADYFDTCPAAACLEQILGVTAVPVRWKQESLASSPKSNKSEPIIPKSEEKTLSHEVKNSDSGAISPVVDETFITGKPPSIDYAPVEDLTVEEVLHEEDPSQLPLPLSRVTTGLSESSIEQTSAIDNTALNMTNRMKGLCFAQPGSISEGSERPGALNHRAVTSLENLHILSRGDQGLALPPLPPSRSSSSHVSEVESHDSKTSRQISKIKPSISLRTDSEFLLRSQSRPTDVERLQTQGSKARPMAEDDDGETVVGIALMGGCLGYQHVDTQRSLWQIRFLVKAHQFHSSKVKLETPKSPSSVLSADQKETAAPLDNIRASLLSRIEYTIYHSLIWIVHVNISHNYFLTPATTPFKRWKRPDCGFVLDPEVEHDRTLYAPIIIWYVLKNCRTVVPQSFLRRVRKNLIRMRNQYKGDEELSDPDHKAKLCILLWYFYGCLDRLLTEVFYTPGYDAFENYTDELKLKTQRRVEEDREDCRKRAKDWQKKAEKVMLASRKQQIGAYSDEHEIVDRLTYLGIELGLVTKEAFKQPSSCVSQARRRIIERTATKELNPGTGVLAFRNSVHRMSTKAPWELTCLAHHGRLAVALWDEAETDLEDLQLVRNDYHRFLTSNFTYVGSWDLSKSAAETWWDLDSTCVISATRLDLRMKLSSLETAIAEKESRIKSPFVDALMLSPGAMSPLQLADASAVPQRTTTKPEISEVRHLEDGILDLLKKQIAQQNKIIESLKSENDVVYDYDWTRMEPGPVLQPNEWVHSLDDTPELFQSSQTKTIQLRKRLLKYLLDNAPKTNEIKINNEKHPSKTRVVNEEITEKRLIHPEWRPETVSDQFDFEELSHVSVADIEVWYDGLVRYELQGRLLILESVDDSATSNVVDLPFYDPADTFKSTTSDADQLALDMWTAYLDGYLRKDNDLSEYMYDDLRNKFQNLSQKDKDVLQDENIRELVKADYKKTLLGCLNDSLVDCSARCRIYIIKRCTPAIVKAFVYMWHTLSIDTYDDHFSDTSNFFNSNKERSRTFHTRFDEGRDDAPFPPRKVIPQSKKKERWWKKVSQEKFYTKYIEERSSSLVMTGDTTGHWWMMSIISSVLPDTVTADAIKAASSSMKEFIHQPATSRCLTFLFFLGLICEYTSERYEDILKELTIVIKLGREVLKKGLEKTQAEDSIIRLKSMLWALEALRILDDRLGESLDKIGDAKVRMLKYISQGPGRRQERLERLCQSLIEDFGKRYDRLANVHSKIEQKIVQITRYREGITAVSNLEDTHTALTQNETVRILTYITIAYLPISYIAAIFSMDIVTSANWSAKIFAIMTGVFFVCTLILARSLRGIIRTWEELGLLARGWKGKSKFFGGTGRGDETDDEFDDDLSDDESFVSESENEDAKSTIVSESNEPEEKEGRKWPMEYLRRRRKSVPAVSKDRSSKADSAKADSVRSRSSRGASERDGSIRALSVRSGTPRAQSVKASSVKVSSIKASSEKRVSLDGIETQGSVNTPRSLRGGVSRGIANGDIR